MENEEFDIYLGRWKGERGKGKGEKGKGVATVDTYIVLGSRLEEPVYLEMDWSRSKQHRGPTV